MCELLSYSLRLDGRPLRDQRRLMLRLLDAVQHQVPFVVESRHDKDLAEGLVSLLDEIADQAHDKYGIDCLLEQPAEASGTSRSRVGFPSPSNPFPIPAGGPNDGQAHVTD